MKNITLGVEDYLSALDSYFVDKTLLIKEIIDYANNKSWLITRPRRFGKSLALSMIYYFFTNKGNYEYAFKNKKISKYTDKYFTYLNKYPVIRLNMKNISADNSETLIRQTIKLISGLYRDYYELVNSDKLFEIEKNNFMNIANEKYDDPYMYSLALKDLSFYLNRHYNQKVIILIDEYDAPIQIAYENGFYDEIIQFYKNLYSSSLKGNDSIYFSLITGVLEISKESLFSGLNNLNTFSIVDDNLIEYFGFTESETIELFKHYNLEYNKEKIKNWYGGFGTKNTEIYNPWSILSYIENEFYSTFWVNTGENSLILNIINNLGISIEDITEYLNNDNKTFIFDKAISYKDLNTIDALLSFLVQTGYLTAKRVIDNNYTINIPNYEIKSIFEKEIINRNKTNLSIDLALNLKSAIINKEEDKISKIIENYILESFSYFELINKKDYQILIVAILAALFDEYIVKSEVNNKNGRCDIMISPKHSKALGIIIELKKYKGIISNNVLDQHALNAIKQIKEKKYYQELIDRNCDEIILYGFVFDNKKLKIKNDTIKLNK